MSDSNKARKMFLGVVVDDMGIMPYARESYLTPELTRRLAIATSRMKPANDHERQVEAGRLQAVVRRHVMSDLH